MRLGKRYGEIEYYKGFHCLYLKNITYRMYEVITAVGCMWALISTVKFYRNSEGLLIATSLCSAICRVVVAELLLLNTFERGLSTRRFDRSFSLLSVIPPPASSDDASTYIAFNQPLWRLRVTAAAARPHYRSASPPPLLLQCAPVETMGRRWSERSTFAPHGVYIVTALSYL